MLAHRSLAARPLVARAARRSVVMRAAPKTGHHTAEEGLIREALNLFFEDAESCSYSGTSGGVNNIVQFVETPAGKRYILRIYNNGNKSEKVQFEHAILGQLNQQKLSFEVPSVLPSKHGRPHELLSSGTECCVFNIIPGQLAKTTSPQEVGRATGELCSAMGKIKVDMVPPIPPYWDLFNAHHGVKTSDVFYAEVARNPAFNQCRESIDFLVGEIKKIEPKLAEFKNGGLPQQIIHGDLHYDNVMTLGDTVSGLLDFEFCAYDLRAMELAVALSKYVGEAEPLGLCEAFVSGYVQHGQLNDAEIEVLPDLINLRIFSNAVYFTGRAIAGEDSIDSLTSRADAYAKRVRWVNANKDKIKETIRSKIAALVAV